MANQSKQSRSSRRSRTMQTGGVLLLIVLVAAVGVIAWSRVGPQAESNDPNVVVNLSTMVGKQAPAFALTTSEGESHEINPGDGRRYVLIFHMGSI